MDFPVFVYVLIGVFCMFFTCTFGLIFCQLCKSYNGYGNRITVGYPTMTSQTSPGFAGLSTTVQYSSGTAPSAFSQGITPSAPPPPYAASSQHPTYNQSTDYNQLPTYNQSQYPPVGNFGAGLPIPQHAPWQPGQMMRGQPTIAYASGTYRK
ncbi:hypothetical protein LOTGIDRAFT_171835 [Lottia gigantea]|uniref:Uncharacterized protein n=1 Tax=Lottia gigantea TaxID=225164 RepID=V4AF20_LOTGI|nr:hypothetical protein LOTGIDRAFT_171835 [Lottia gigantea]ESP02634.1 hypothetical protein LOTGIDRAFT_171835 [Lottia gigantea]